MNRSIEKILVDIIEHELNLPNNYGETSKNDVIPSVIIYNQNIKLFNTDKLQIVIKNINTSVYSNRSELMVGSNGTLLEVQDLNLQKMMQIDCYSRNNDARDRYWEVIAALRSNYAQQQMDIYNFKLGTIAQANNISGIDGGSDINRYTITFTVLTHEQKTTSIDYYDKFQTVANNEYGRFADIQTYSEQ